uniref:Resolvase/invertase-type recombinase catalytic domain-containing protein n=1 Tax=uncultured marine group II/III euryarchaeote KM3_87_G11 TaxID=1456534 RepID=A0A075HTZ9_9EURY|nr:hypothetical protein [uncultured marine group II/III euryarchaeote KM3_87_G11]
MTRVNVGNWQNERVAAYIRTSQGRGRDDETAAQYFEIETDWLPKVPRGAIMRAQRQGYLSKSRATTITGRTQGIGGRIVVYDEGVASGFTEASERPVLTKLLEDAKSGRVTKVILASTDRLANDPILWGRVADTLREYGAMVHDIATGYEVTALSEAVDMADLGNNLMLMFYAGTAEVSKKQQIAKSKIGARRAVAGGVCSGRMDWILSHDYALLNELLTELGENMARIKGMGRAEKSRELKALREEGKPVSGQDIARIFGKINKKGEADNKWLKRWRTNFAEWNEAGVLEEWISTVAAVQELDSLVKRSSKGAKQVASALTKNSCFLLYPAGKDVAGELTLWAPMTREDIIAFANS